MRKGPHPLAVHLGMAAANISGIQKYAAGFDVRMDEADAVAMMRGIQLYQNYPHRFASLCAEVVLNVHGVQVKAPIMKEGDVAKGSPILLVPSLINKSDILDITEEKSALRFLRRQGRKAYLLDWGALYQAHDDAGIDMDTLVVDRLSATIKALSEREGQPIDVLGYCMGGTLCVAAHAFAGEYINKTVLLAAPWDFHAPSTELSRNVRIWAPLVRPHLEQGGALPSEWVQALFASLDPNGSAQKFITFSEMDTDSDAAKTFVRVEDWLNDGVDLPVPIAQHCIQEWFTDNTPYKKNWHIKGRKIDPSLMHGRTLIIASHRDRLVPHACASAIIPQLPEDKADILSMSCGHIGLIAGKNAQHDVWEPIHKWLDKK